MILLRRVLRCRSGQTTSEYMLVVSVISIAAMAAFAWLGDPGSPPQQAGRQLTDNFARGLTNNGGSGTIQRVD